jgi:hypothetical protein
MIYEIAEFELNNGVSVEEFLEIDARFQEEFAYQIPGLLRRTTARGETGTWIVINLWDNADSANGARNVTAGRDALEKMHQVINFDTHKVARYTML